MSNLQNKHQSMSSDDNFIYLTVALTTLLVAMAFAQQFFDTSVQRLVQSATVVTLITVVWRADVSEFVTRKNYIFLVVIFFNAVAGYWLDSSNLQYTHVLILLVFFILTALRVAKQVLFSGEVTGNNILGAICLYILMGLIWALGYTLVAMMFTNSFNGVGETHNWFDLLPTFVYFSFVTLTTLGFGDISPVIAIARMLVYLEAVVGQFYLTILVASLVGAHMSNRAKTKS
ncbi:potassium channel family protein [Thalassotalea euphylliae]|uniref:potassium channel family protein n=1 Tax=Thalassotalea euphylliae TaxID=1655234 RepID=UPI0036391E5F